MLFFFLSFWIRIVENFGLIFSVVFYFLAIWRIIKVFFKCKNFMIECKDKKLIWVLYDVLICI